MNWKKACCMLGAVLLCTSLVAQAGPPGASTAAKVQAGERAITAQAPQPQQDAKVEKPRKVEAPEKVAPPSITPAAAIHAGGIRGYDFEATAPFDSEVYNTCGAGNDCALRASEDHIWLIHLPNPGVWTFSLCDPVTTWDTYMYVGTSSCTSDLGYNDDFCGLQSQVTANVTGNVAFVTIEGYSSSGCGNYVLHVWEEQQGGYDFEITAPYTWQGPPLSTCGAGNDCLLRPSTEHMYLVHVPYDGMWTFSLCGSAFDTYLYVGTYVCGGDVGYNDDYCGLQSQLTVNIPAGDYYVTIEAYSSTQCGDYVLNIWSEIGACCVGLDCVGDMSPNDCAALGGVWWQGQSCASFVCPETPDNDTCQNATVVNGPYPVTVEDECTLMATIDCPGFLNWTAIWYDLELPYAANDVTVTICPTAEDIGTVGVILMNDCNCDDYILYSSYTWMYCPSGYLGIQIEFEDIVGPGRIYFPAYVINSAGGGMCFDITFDVTEAVPCVLDCVPNEGEPVCYDNYADQYNGGCNWVPYMFQPLECGQYMCGTSGVYLYYGWTYREMDWFTFTTPTDSIITWEGQAEFPVAMWILNPGSGNCLDFSVIAFGTADECEWLTIQSPCVPAGTYWSIIAPADWGAYPCGSKWEAQLTCQPCVVPGACCVGGQCIGDMGRDECVNVYGGDWYINESCAYFQCPVECPNATITVVIRTDSWPYETTWDVRDHDTGIIIGSGGPYANQYTTYVTNVCVDYGTCSDFTIYDSYGDGIYAPGGYEVRWEGTPVCSTLGSGWYGSIAFCNMIGDGCVWPTGACCVGLDCVATNTEAECDALGGHWYEGETCPDFVCPECDVDFCVTAPYDSPIRTTCGAGNDCFLRASVDHEYRVTIPNDGLWVFSLCDPVTNWDTYMYLGTTVCSQDIGYNDDYCGLQSQISAFLTAGDYYCTIEGYASGQCGSYVLHVYELQACDVECPPNGTPEGEPICYDNYIDTYNGGCNSSPYVFQPIGLNETICATSGTFYFSGWSYRDTDWFEHTLTETMELTWRVCAEFESLIFVINAGSGNCYDFTILGSNITSAFIGNEITMTLGPGTYWFWAGPRTFGYGVPCGSEYIATLSTGLAWCDFDMDADVDEDDFWLFVDGFGACVGNPKYFAAADHDGDGCITALDYQAWIQCFREQNPGQRLPVMRSLVRTSAPQNAGAQPAPPRP